MKKRNSMFMFEMRCVRCENEIIAPHKTELLDNNAIRHLWPPVAARPTRVISALPGQGPVSEETDDER
jgi:hypothetical protein